MTTKVSIYNKISKPKYYQTKRIPLYAHFKENQGEKQDQQFGNLS